MSLGLFDCNETKNQEVIKLLKFLTVKYVPLDGDEVIDEVFFGGLCSKIFNAIYISWEKRSVTYTCISFYWLIISRRQVNRWACSRSATSNGKCRNFQGKTTRFYIKDWGLASHDEFSWGTFMGIWIVLKYDCHFLSCWFPVKFFKVKLTSIKTDCIYFLCEIIPVINNNA